MLIRANKLKAQNTVSSGMVLLIDYLAEYNPCKSASELHQAAVLLAEAIEATDDQIKIEKINAAEAICRNLGPIAQSARATVRLNQDEIDVNDISLLKAINHNDKLLPSLLVHNYYVLGLTYIKLQLYEVAKHYLIQGMRLEWINNLPPQYSVKDIFRAIAVIEVALAKEKVGNALSQIKFFLKDLIPLNSGEKQEITEGDNIAEVLMNEDDALHLKAWRKKAESHGKRVSNTVSIGILTTHLHSYNEEWGVQIKKSAERIFRYLNIPCQDPSTSPKQISELWSRNRFLTIHASLKINIQVFGVCDLMQALHVNDMGAVLRSLNPKADAKIIKDVAGWVAETYYAASVGPLGLGSAQKIIIENDPSIIFPRSFYFLYAHHLMIMSRYKEALEQLKRVLPPINQFQQKKAENSSDRAITKMANYLRAACEYSLEEAKIKQNFQQTINCFHVAVSEDSDVRYPILTVTGAKYYLEMLFKAQGALEPGMSMERLQKIPMKGSMIGYIQKLLKAGDRAKSLSIALAFRRQNPFISHQYTFLSSKFYDVSRQKFKDLDEKVAATANWDLNIGISVILDTYLPNVTVTDVNDLLFHHRNQRTWFVFKGEFHLSGLLHQRITRDMSYAELVAENSDYADSITKRASCFLNNNDKLFAYEIAYKIFSNKQYKAKIVKLKKLLLQPDELVSEEKENAPVSEEEVKAKTFHFKAEPEAKCEVNSDSQQESAAPVPSVESADKKQEEKNKKAQAKKARKLCNRVRRAQEAKAQEEQKLALEKQLEDCSHSLKSQLTALQENLLREHSRYELQKGELKRKEKQKIYLDWQIKKIQQSSEKALFTMLKQHYRQLFKRTWQIKKELLKVLYPELVNRDEKISRQMQLKSQRRILGHFYREWVAQKRQGHEILLKRFNSTYQMKFSLKEAVSEKKELLSAMEEKEEFKSDELGSPDLLLAKIQLREEELERITAKNKELWSELQDYEEQALLIQENAMTEQRRTQIMLRKLLEQQYQQENRESGEGHKSLLWYFQKLNSPSMAKDRIHQHYDEWVAHLKQNYWNFLQLINAHLHPHPEPVTYQQPTYEQLQIQYLQQNYVALYNAHAALYSNYCYLYHQGLIEYQNQIGQMQGMIVADDAMSQVVPANYGMGNYYNFFQATQLQNYPVPNEEASLDLNNDFRMM